MKQEIIFQNSETERLDKFLVTEISDYSRSQIQKLIKEGLVRINGKTEAVHYFLKKGDKIVVELKEDAPRPTKITVIPKIIFENDDYLVINKPTGLSVEGQPKEANLIDWLRDEKIKPSQDEDFNNRSGLIHRLDKGVSGTMLISKNPDFFHHLKDQFKQRKVKKIYLALVHGVIEPEDGKLNFLIARGKDGKMVSRPEDQEGKVAITEYKVLERFKTQTYVEVRILTGRTHQIRVHFFAFNHPVVGDKLYFNKKNKPVDGLNRLFLHSHLIGFYDLENNWQEYKIELPKELKEVLKVL